jgi:cardiolipin synthase A/B
MSPLPADRSVVVRRTLEGIIGVPFTEGNSISILRNGDEIFPSMLESIERAEHTIDFLTFVYWSGDVGTRFAEALSGRARAGVRVRLLLDSWGAHPIDRPLVDEMEAAGVNVQWFRPLHRFEPHKMDHRTHRKVVIVDESIGFTGGVGIADEWQGDARNESEWRDTHFRVRGPCVDGLRAAFLDNWLECDDVMFEADIDRFPEQEQEGGSVIQSVRGASEAGMSDISTAFNALLQLAEERVRITTAYFVPDEEMTDRLCATADRGVSVEVLLPGPNADKRFVQLAGEAEFAELLDHGIQIAYFQPSMLHAKIMTVDGILAMVGSANVNARSTERDEEINLIILDDDVVATLDDHFDDDLRRSEHVTREGWEDRSLTQRVMEGITRPLQHHV